MSSKDDDVRRHIADRYGQAPTAEPGCCDSSRSDQAVLTQLGYDGVEVACLPAGVTVSTCGCGSPVSLSDMQPGEVVLDLGCGAGLDLLLAAKNVGPRGRVIGVDMTDVLLDRARANVAAAGVANIELRKGYIEDIPVADESVDSVISNCVINLSPNKHRVFAEIARVLKPGGRIRVADVVAEDLPEWIRRRVDLYDACIAGAISETEYVTGLATAGLTNVSVGGRYVYDREQLGDVATGPQGSCAGASDVADALVGRVWSVYISARKPAQQH